MKLNKLLIALFLVVLMMGSGLAQFGEGGQTSSNRTSHRTSQASTSKNNAGNVKPRASKGGRKSRGRSLWKLYQDSK